LLQPFATPAHPKSVPKVHRAAKNTSQAQARFLRMAVGVGRTLAFIALSTSDEAKRTRNIEKARAAYYAVHRFWGRVTLDNRQARELAKCIEGLKRDLMALGEKRLNIVARRLDDRIRVLAANAEEFPVNSLAFRDVIALTKTELVEYFEREMHPSYQADRRCSQLQRRSAER
jgi:hypothetical protein